MQQDPGSALSDLVRSSGPEGLDDPRRVRAMLRDAAPEARLEVSLLVAAVEEGVGQRLARSSGGLLGGEIERLSGDLVSRRGLSPGNADWAVRTLSWAVGRSPRPAPLVVDAGGPERGRPDTGPDRVVTHPGGGWEPPRSDPGVPESWVIGGGGGGPVGGGGSALPVPTPPVPWWQRVPVIAGITAGIVVLLVVVVAVVLGQRSGSGDTTAGDTTGDGGTTEGGGTTDGGGTTGQGGGTGGGTAGDGGTAGEGGGTGGDVSVGTGVYPDAQELALLELLPDEYTGSACDRWAGPEDSPLYMHRPLAAILCAPSGGVPDNAVFVRYASDVESEMTFSVVFPQLTGGDCAQNAPMADVYTQDGLDAGYFGCLIDDDGTAYVAWTRTGRGVYAYGSAESGDLTSLYDWFINRTYIE